MPNSRRTTATAARRVRGAIQEAGRGRFEGADVRLPVTVTDKG
jgi:hypothetical protein